MNDFLIQLMQAMQSGNRGTPTPAAPPAIDPAMIYGTPPQASPGADVLGQPLNPLVQALQQHSGFLNLLRNQRNLTTDATQQALTQ